MQKKRLVHYLEEFLLVILILLNFLDFIEFLPADLDLIKKVFSWTALGYVLFRVSLTGIFFNHRHKFVDLFLIVAYFLLIFKNLATFSKSVVEEFSIMYELQLFIVQKSVALEVFFLLVGLIVILILSLYAAIKIPINKPSLLYIFHEHGKPKGFFQVILRTISVYIIFLAFFVVVFNLMMEWLAIAIDAPLVMLGLLFYLFIVMRHYHKYSAESLVYRIGEFGEKFYEKFVSLFHYKSTFFLGISGMLVLHLFTDALSFIFPYVTSIQDTLYFSSIGPGHEPLVHLFIEQTSSLGLLDSSSLAILLILNVVGALSLLLLPAFIWYIVFSKKSIKISSFAVCAIIISVLTTILAPAFKIKRLNSNNIVGVDITTQHIQSVFVNHFVLLLTLFSVFVVLMFLFSHFRRYHFVSIFGVAMIFFSYYVYLFFTSQFIYFTALLSSMADLSGRSICLVLSDIVSGSCHSLYLKFPFIGIFFESLSYLLKQQFIVIFALTMLFYVYGFIMFVDEFLREKVYKKIK